MSYTPTTWKAGDVITATKLNKLEKGVQNEQVGPQGAPGPTGSDGLTPTIGDNGNWFLGDTDTGKPSRGEAGPAGTDGAPGVDGAPGADGADGADGVGVPAGGTAGQVLTKKSATDYDTAWVDPHSGGGGTGTDGVGIQSMEQTTTSTESGGLNEWTATLTDGSQSVLQVRNGEQGDPGTPGANGDTPYIGANGNWFIGSTDTGIAAEGKLVPDDSIAYDSATKEIAVALPNKPITRAEYDALSDEDKQKAVIYDIVDDFTSESVVLQNEQSIYSATDEVVVGRWIDGKPLYRRTYISAMGAAGVDGNQLVDLSDLGTVQFIGIEGGYFRSSLINAEIMPLSFCYSSSNMTVFWIDGTAIFERHTEASYNSAECYISVKYTKTTDTATISIPTAAEMAAAYEEGVQSA